MREDFQKKTVKSCEISRFWSVVPGMLTDDPQNGMEPATEKRTFGHHYGHG